MDKMLRSKKWILLFLLPALLIFTATVFVPIIWSMVYSLYSWNGVSAMRFVGLENFADMFSDKNFVQSVVNNLIFVAINVVGQLFVGAFVAVLLTYVGKGREVFKTLYFTPVILASVAVAKIWSKFFSVDPDGVVNSLLELVGLGGLKTAWLGNAATSLGSVSLVESYWLYGAFHGDHLFRFDYHFRGCAGIRRYGWGFRLENVLEDQAAADERGICGSAGYGG